MANKSTQENDNLKNALCYLPIVPFVLAFTEKHKSEEFKKHMYRGIVLFGAYMFLHMFGSMIFGINWSLYFNGIVTLAYFIAIGVLAYKAYQGEELDVLNDFEEKVKDNIK